jgi:hypothetical protein
LASGNHVGLAYFGGKPTRPAHILNEVRSWGGLPAQSLSLKNRAIILIVKALEPNESRSLRFYRMGRFLQRPLEERDLAAYSADFLKAVAREGACT